MTESAITPLEQRLADAEARLEALEDFATAAQCAGKHRYQQGGGELGDTIFCQGCGSITRLKTEEKPFGLAGGRAAE